MAMNVKQMAVSSLTGDLEDLSSTNGAAHVNVASGTFPEDEVLITTHTVAAGATLEVNNMESYKWAVLIPVESTGGDTTQINIRGDILGQQTTLLGAGNIGGGSDATTFSSGSGYYINLGFPTIKYIADGTTGEWTLYVAYHKTGTFQYYGT